MNLPMKVLEINGLSKQYGRLTAVNKLSLEVKQGMVYGILGPNGSGKTTTLGMILGIIKASGGSYTWFEDPSMTPNDARKRVGALLETPNFYPYLDAVQNLKIVAKIKKSSEDKFDEILELVNLNHRRLSKFNTYSLGMKQRLAIAAALVGDPDVLIFDEPTNGLDPQGIKEMRDLIMTIAGRGKTILLASHILVEVEKTCDHLAIIKNGNLLATGSVGSILHSDTTIEVGAAADLARLEQLLLGARSVKSVTQEESKLIAVMESGAGAAELNKLAFDSGILLNHLAERQNSLEAEFLKITSDNSQAA